MYVVEIFVPEECHALVVLGFLFTILATVFVILRFITKICVLRNVGVDDGFIILANVGVWDLSRRVITPTDIFSWVLLGS